MPKLRKDTYGYSYCVNCSTEQPKMARMTTHGTGDHTWNDIEIVDYDTAQRIIAYEASQRKERPYFPKENKEIDSDITAVKEVKQKVKETYRGLDNFFDSVDSKLDGLVDTKI